MLHSSLLANKTSEFQIEEASTDELEERLETIETQLAQLADYQIISGMGPIGYRSKSEQSEQAEGQTHWVEVQLEEPSLVDQIVLVPSLWRSTRGGVQADAFPKAFKVLIRNGNGDYKQVASYGPEDSLLPRIAPVQINLTAQMATHVRVEANQLSARAWDHVECLQLSELLVFSGLNNVALHQRVTASSSEEIDSRGRRHLVDGFTPYLMGLNTGEQSTAFLVQHESSIMPEIIIDLEETYAIDQINLHSIESTDTIPQTVPSNYAFPKGLIAEGANSADFSDARPLFEYHIDSVFDTGPIRTERFNAAHCRYVRLRVLEPYSYPDSNEHTLGFAEIEIIANGHNVALNKPVSSNVQPTSMGRHIEALTDGRNFFGSIIPMRDWLAQLVTRHELEREHPLIVETLKQRYAQQKAILQQLVWLVIVLVLVAIFLTALTRLMGQRSMQRLRERIAADLHDELGANLHAIGLLSDLSQKAKDNPTKLAKLLERIRTLTARTGAAARHCTNMLEAEDLYQDVPDHIHRVSRRLLYDVDHQLDMKGADLLSKLSPRRRIDFCLFYQECLTNILRHSEATVVRTDLSVNDNNVKLVISDNGKGLAHDQAYSIPKSISRRSRLLGSKVTVETPQEGGTTITLRLKLSRRFNF